MAIKSYWRECLAILIGIVLVASTQRHTFDGRNDLRFVPPPANVEYFTFGYAETVSDLLWLRVVQDIDICENAKNGIAHTGAPEEAGAPPKCKMGWVYQMIDAITKLTPKWRLPYATGAILLSVAVDDIEGATKIFEKALKQFPYDYNINYNAAYHYIWEVKNPKRAAELLLVAARVSQTPWMYSLAAKLYSEEGQLGLGIKVLEDALEKSENDKGKARIEMRLKELKAKRAALEAAQTAAKK